MTRAHVTTLFEIAGFVLLVGGVARISVTAALVLAGALVLAAGVYADLRA
jgi:hypothetical protein